MSAKRDKLLDEALRALRVIHTWASFRDGVALTPKHIIRLCDKVLTRQKG